MVNKKKDTHTAIYESDGATTTYGHTWNNKTVTKEPTTTDEGEKLLLAQTVERHVFLIGQF